MGGWESQKRQNGMGKKGVPNKENRCLLKTRHLLFSPPGVCLDLPFICLCSVEIAKTSTFSPLGFVPRSAISSNQLFLPSAPYLISYPLPNIKFTVVSFAVLLLGRGARLCVSYAHVSTPMGIHSVQVEEVSRSMWTLSGKQRQAAIATIW